MSNQPTSGIWAYYRGESPWTRTDIDLNDPCLAFRFAPDAPLDLVVRSPAGEVKSLGTFPAGAVVVEIDSPDQDYAWVLARYHEIKAARQDASLARLSPAS